MSSDSSQADSQDVMRIDSEQGVPTLSRYSPTQSTSQETKRTVVTIEDSMDVISELISEIQATDEQRVQPPSIHQDHSKHTTKKTGQMRLSIARKPKAGTSSLTFLPQLKRFFQTILATSSITILPIRMDSQAQPLKLTSQVNELTLIGSKTFLKASRHTGGSIAGDLHIATTLSFEEVCNHPTITNWMTLNGYYLILSDCQSSDMVKIGFLSRIRPFTWREDLRTTIKDTLEWRENPFQFRMFYGSLSCNKKSKTAPVLLVEVERGNISAGLAFFCNMFDGENLLSPCGIPYLFLTLYQNTLTDKEREKIIDDINHHVGYTQLIRLYGLEDIDNHITLQQNVKVKLRKLLLNLRAPQSSTRLFCQVEKEANKESVLCAFDSDLYEVVMANLPNISLLIRQCIIEADWKNVFCNADFSLLIPQKVITTKGGFTTSKTIPQDIQEHTSVALSKMKKVDKRSSSSSISSFSNTSMPNSTQSTSTTTTPAHISPSNSSAIEQRFTTIEKTLNSSTTRMDNIETLCLQLKSNTDIISQNIQQLATDFYNYRPPHAGCRSPAPKSQRLSAD
jgi:hypothetical protein